MDVAFVNSTLTLSIKILSNNCERIGISTCLIDSEAFDQLERDVIKVNPKILAISWNFNETIYKFICLSLKRIKEVCPNLKVIIHSYGASYDWKNLSQVNEIDYIVGGECDKSLPELCKKLLNNEIPAKLDYLTTQLPSLEDYDYENNFVIIKDILIIATSRNCIYSNNRCWYCPCYNLAYRRLDLDKIIAGLKKNVDFSKINRITLIDTEVLPEVINRLYKEFHKSIHAFVLFKDLVKLSPELKDSNSNFIFGSNIERSGLHSNVVYNTEVIDVVLDKVKDILSGNCISTTILVESKEDEENHKELLKVFAKYPFINPNFCYYRKTPRNFDGNDLKENIYLEYKRNPYVWFDCVTNMEDAL